MADTVRHAPGEAPQTFDPVAFSREEPDTIFLLTSLTSASSTIITATARLEHILNSNKIAFKAVDLATDDKARRLWQWKSKGRKLPGVAKNGEVLGDFKEIEEWNEYGELRQNLGVSKKKKKKKPTMDGSTVSSNISTTASPNFVPALEAGSSNPAGGVPTAFSQASIAAAAAAAGKKRIKKSVSKSDTKKPSSKTAKVPVASITEEEAAPAAKKAEAAPKPVEAEEAPKPAEAPAEAPAQAPAEAPAEAPAAKPAETQPEPAPAVEKLAAATEMLDLEDAKEPAAEEAKETKEPAAGEAKETKEPAPAGETKELDPSEVKAAEEAPAAKTPEA